MGVGDGNGAGRGYGGRERGKKKDEVMKWKSFTLRLLLLVMVGKRIKEPGIFAARRELEVTRNESIFRFPEKTPLARARARAYEGGRSGVPAVSSTRRVSRRHRYSFIEERRLYLFIVYKVFSSFFGRRKCRIVCCRGTFLVYKHFHSCILSILIALGFACFFFVLIFE